MDLQLDKRMREIVKERLPLAMDGAVTSEQLLEQLEKEGFIIPDNAMENIFNIWFKRGLVKGNRPVNRDAHIQHGSAIIFETYYGF